MNRQIVVFQWFFAVLLGSLPFLLFAGGPPDRATPEVDSRAMEVRVIRHGALLWRYTRFNTESDYPCLRFEAISADENWRIVDQQDVCDVVLPDGHRLAFENTAYAGFSDIQFSPEEPEFRFRIEYIRKTAAGEINMECRLPITGDRFGTVKCQ